MINCALIVTLNTEAVAAAIADGVTDPHLLEGLLFSAVAHPFHL